MTVHAFQSDVIVNGTLVKFEFCRRGRGIKFPGSHLSAAGLLTSVRMVALRSFDSVSLRILYETSHQNPAFGSRSAERFDVHCKCLLFAGAISLAVRLSLLPRQ